MKNHYPKNMNFLWILLLFGFADIASTQDLECKVSNLCTEIIVLHTIQLKSMCPYKNIRFRNMTEETLQVGVFHLCHETTVLDLSNNKIREIRAGAFLGLNVLRELYLANNRIEKIEPGTFHTLTELQVFVLAGNKLKALPEYEFTSKSIRYFNINNNLIPNMEKTALLNLRKVELVDLSMNKMDFINPNSLINLHPGAKIILSNNLLTNISMNFNITPIGPIISRSGVALPASSTTPPTSKNTILVASGNAITTLSSSVLGELYKLNISVLDLAFNYITEIDPRTFYQYQNLQELHLSHNRIKLLNAELITHLNHLTALDLSYNQLIKSIFNLHLPESLVYLNYSHNRIDEYTYNHWTPTLIRKYITLDISNNAISYIDPNRFCKYVDHINIAYNQWSCPLLYSIVRNLEMRNIHVDFGFDYKVSNVKGIPCESEANKLLKYSQGLNAEKMKSANTSSHSSKNHSKNKNASTGVSNVIKLNMNLIFFTLLLTSITC